VRCVSITWLAVLTACGRIGFESGDPPSPDTAGSGRRAFRGLCELERVAIITNGISIDDATGAQLQTSLAVGCSNSPVVRMVSQDDPAIVEPSTGRPLLPPDELAVIGGGDGPNRALAYLLASGDTPLTWDSSTVRERGTGRVIASGSTTTTFDFPLLMVIEQPNGLRVLSGQGQRTQGTVAAGLWFATRLSPDITTNDHGWTVASWTDDDGTLGATPADTFVELESGGGR